MDLRREFNRGKSFEINQERNSPLQFQRFAQNTLKDGPYNNERQSIDQNISNQYNPLRNQQDQSQINKIAYLNRQFPSLNDQQQRQSEESLQIDQRHDELRKQIAQKEKLLAEMTNERQNNLRLKGQKHLLQGESMSSLFQNSNIGNDHSIDEIRKLNMPQNRSRLAAREVMDSRQSSLPQNINFKPSSSQTRTQNPQQLQNPSPLRVSRDYQNDYRSRSRSGEGARWNHAHADESEQNYSFRAGVEPAPRNTFSDSPLRNGRSSQQEIRISGLNPIPRYTQPTLSQQPSILKREIGGYNDVSQQAKRELSQPLVQKREIGGYTGEISNARDSLFKQRIEMLAMDNASLQNRLNNVSEDLQRIKAEREQLKHEMQLIENSNNVITRQLNQKDEVDMENIVLKQDCDKRRLDNQQLEEKLKQEQQQVDETSQKLTSANQIKQNLTFDANNLNSDYDKKVQMIDDFRKKRDQAKNEIMMANENLARFNGQEHQFNHDNIQLNTLVEQLSAERQRLIAQLQDMTRSFDECIEDTSKMQFQITQKQKWHSQIIAGRVLEQTLKLIQNKLSSNCFKELKNYSAFDKKCQDKLIKLSSVLYKLGLQIQKEGLNQWYYLSLKPLPLRKQNEDFGVMIQCNKLQSKVFYALKNFRTIKHTEYLHKSDAVERAKFLLNRSRKIELKRAISIWKEKLRFDKLKQKVLLKLCTYSKTGQLWQALTRWKEFSVSLEQAVRIHFLKQDFSQRTFIQRIFGQIRNVTQYEKNQRQKTLRLCLKAWKDFKSNKAYLLRQNMTTLQFLQTNKQMTLINCFNGLKHNKELKKQKLVQKAIKKDVDVGINQIEQQTEEIKQQVFNRNISKACYTIRDMISKKVYSYWSKWHKETTWKQATLNRKHKDRIVRLYLTRLKTAFGLWQLGLNFIASQEEQGGNQDILVENEQLQNENLNFQQELEFCEEQTQKAKRTTLDKISRRLKNKTERLALNMWLEEVKRKQTQEQKFYKIMMKWQRGKQGEAFTKYKEWLHETIQDEKNEQRCKNFIDICNFKTKTACFNSICYMTQRKQKAKKTLKKMINKLERSIKLQLMTMWLQGSNVMTQEQLTQRQVEITQMLEEENKLLSTIERKKQEQLLSIGDTGKTRQNQAYRQIGIYMVRHYEQSIKGAFTTWKDRLRDFKHKRSMLRTHINQMKRAAFSDFRRRCRQFANIARQNEKLETIKVKQIEQKTLIQASKHGKENQNKKVEETKGIIEKNEQEIDILKVEREKTLQFLERRSQNLNFMSRKRMIFLSWRNVTKQQTSALKLIQKLIRKDALLKAFHEIKYIAINENIGQKITRTLNIYLLRKYKRTLTDAMSEWKKFSLKFADSKTINVAQETEEIVKTFNEHVDQIKEVNTERCLKVFVKNNYSNLWNGWVNITKNFKKLRQSKETFLANQKNMQKQLVVKLWYRRIQATNKARQMELVVSRHNAKNLQKNCFRGMKQQLKNLKSLNCKFGGLECLLKTKITQEAFKTLKSFVISKDLAKGNQKYIATYDLMRFMRQAHNKNLRVAFYAYREKTAGYKTYKENPKLKQIFKKFGSCNLRSAFDRWRNIDSKISLLQELYDSGPVRADDWEAGREIHNLVEFMRDERYSEDEINQFYKNSVKGRNENIMRKYIIQMKMKGRQDNVIVYCLDRWKKFTRIRKLVSHTLRLCENRTQDVKADLSFAFNKWKNDYQNMDIALCRLPYQTLKDIGVRTSFQVNTVADELAENNSIANHLQLQRDEFLNFFIKSQRLGLAFLKDRCTYSQFQAWSRWFYQLSKSQQEQLEREMRDASYLHANLDQRSSFLKEKNEGLESENNDLTSFKNDKEVIKKNLASIQEERNQLRDQLDKTEEYYEALVEENENLKRLIAEAEKYKSQQGPNTKFLNMPSLKENNDKKENQSQGGQRSAQKQPETEEQRKTRERFEKLQQLQASAGIR